MRCPPPLIPVIATIPELDEVVPDTAPPPPCDAYVPIMSLLLKLDITLDTIPAPIPYVAALPERIQKMAPFMAGSAPKVGLVWAGNPGFLNDHRRSLPHAPTLLAPLLEVPGMTFFSFQVGARRTDLDGIPWARQVIHLAPALGDFADTAAALTSLDLLISVDTAIAHLAGALGVPTWLLLPFNPDWRWLRGRRDTPWYPSLTLYRQDDPMEWAPVIDRLARDLHAITRD